MSNNIDWEKVEKYRIENKRDIEKHRWLKKTQIERVQQFGIINDYLKILLDKEIIKWEERDECFEKLSKWILRKWIEFENEYLNNYFLYKKEKLNGKENNEIQ